MLNLAGYVLMTEDKVQWLKDKHSEPDSIDTSHDDHAEHREPHAVIDHLASMDPTPKKAYTPWIVNQYKKKDFRQEDGERVRTALSNFDRYKGKVEKKDINQHKSLSDLEDHVAPHLGTAASGKEEKRQVKEEGAEKIHDQDGVTVHRLDSHAAACQYGSGTKWCTTQKSSHMFDMYRKQGPLYVVQTPPTERGGPKRKFQIHFHSNQVMDEKDQKYDLTKLVKNHPSLQNVDAFKGQHPVFDDHESFRRKAMNNETYPGGRSAFTIDAQSAHPKLSSDEVSHYYDKHVKNSGVVTTDVLQHRNTPAHVIDDVANNLSSLAGPARTAVVTHLSKAANMSDHVFHSLSATTDGRKNLTTNHDLSSERVEHLHKVIPSNGSPYDDLNHENLAVHPNATPNMLHDYAHSDNQVLARHALMHPNTRAETHDSVYESRPAMHMSMAASPHTPDHLLQRLSNHTAPYIADRAKKTLAERTKK